MMECKGVEMQPHRWQGGTPTAWRMIATVDALPDHEDFRYEEIQCDNGTFFISVLNNYVSYLYEKPSDRHGYGGRAFHLTMIDGLQREIVGPWSSRASVFNGLLRQGRVNFYKRDYIVDVTFKEEGRSWLVAAAARRIWVENVLEQHMPDWQLVEEQLTYDDFTEVRYDVTPV